MTTAGERGAVESRGTDTILGPVKTYPIQSVGDKGYRGRGWAATGRANTTRVRKVT